MNATLFIPSVTFMNQSITTTVQPWFLPLDIVSIICISLTIAITIFFLFVIIFDKICHTVPMMLVANTCLVELLLAINQLWMTVFAFQNDFNHAQYQDSLCIFRGYLNVSLYALQNCSFLLQSIYRYLVVVYPNRPFWQTTRIQLLFIGFSWLFAFLYPIVFLFNGEAIYDIDSQICQIPLRLSLSVIYTALCIYIVPVTTTMFIYFILIRYVRRISKRVVHANTLLHAQRELKMARRVIIVLMILFTAGFPYALFVFISFFTTPPKYHLRIAYGFINVSLLLAMVALFQFTDILKASVTKILKYRPNAIAPILT